ncbi:MAG: NADP-dependent phosphogluconate dehydrogenase [Patescibacteria group bacterium]
MSSQVGVIGLGTMGSALARNIANHGFKVSVWNRTQEKVETFLKNHGNDFFYGAKNFEDFIESLETPRRIVLMVPAGAATEEVLSQLKRTLRAGDCILEGGNSFYKDTEKLLGELGEQGIHFLGTGVSGGEEGALKGPSIMPGGSRDAWDEFKPILESIAAADFEGRACVAYMGNGGAGHYVKMVHNGIEYAEMQALSEAYDLLRSLFQLRQEEIGDIFEKWSQGELSSFLMDISVDVLRKKDDGDFLLDVIVDRAGQKGTGRWTTEEALRLGVPAPSFANAVFARAFSAEKEKRLKLAAAYPAAGGAPKMLVSEFVNHLEKALLASRIAHFEQGIAVLTAANKEYGFNLNFADILRVWQGGCIIRCSLLKNFAGVLSHSETLYGGLWTEQTLTAALPSWKKIVAAAVEASIPLPALSSALLHFESMRREHLPANFIQGLRDRFGSHGYERVDQEGEFHTVWP